MPGVRELRSSGYPSIYTVSGLNAQTSASQGIMPPILHVIGLSSAREKKPQDLCEHYGLHAAVQESVASTFFGFTVARISKPET